MYIRARMYRSLDIATACLTRRHGPWRFIWRGAGGNSGSSHSTGGLARLSLYSQGPACPHMTLRDGPADRGNQNNKDLAMTPLSDLTGALALLAPSAPALPASCSSARLSFTYAAQPASIASGDRHEAQW